MTHTPRIAIVTDVDCSSAGEFGSTGLRTAFVLARIGIDVTLFAATPSGIDVEPLQDSLRSAGLDPQHIAVGQSLSLPIDSMFGADCCLIDIADLTRFRFLADLPVHTWPGARLVGVIDRLIGAEPDTAWAIIERLDAISGSISAAMNVTNTGNEDDLVEVLRQAMQTTNLRIAQLQSEQGDLLQLSRSSSDRVILDKSEKPPPVECTITTTCAVLALRLGFSESLHLAAGLQNCRELSPEAWKLLVAETQARTDQ